MASAFLATSSRHSVPCSPTLISATTFPLFRITANQTYLLPTQQYAAITYTVLGSGLLLPYTMSSGPPKLDIRYPIRARFPSELIQAFGFGEVGTVYLTFAANGTIRKAEAELIDATFKSMLMDSPEILRIFGQRGDSIHVEVLHPAPKFRLDALQIIVDDEGELDMTSFDVGRLVDITNLRAAARYGWSKAQLDRLDPLNEGAVHKRVRESFGSNEAKKANRGRKPRTNGAAKDELDVDGQLAQATDAALSLRNTSSPARHRRPATPMPAGVQGQKMGVVFQQILDNLSDAAKATYTLYVTDTRKETAKNTAKKVQFHQELRDFVHMHNIVELHNAYADIQKKSGSNTAYHLPIFDLHDIVAS
jgi:hypothetical protein